MWGHAKDVLAECHLDACVLSAAANRLVELSSSSSACTVCLTQAYLIFPMRLLATLTLLSTRSTSRSITSSMSFWASSSSLI